MEGTSRRILIIRKELTEPEKERKILIKILENYRKNLRHIILRIDYKHIEIDVKGSNDVFSDMIRYLTKYGYEVVEEIDVDDEDKEWGNWKTRFLQLYSQGRFWEIHEMLEDLWRERGDCILRSLILFVIPYIKIQMGQYREAIKAYNRFLKYECRESKDHGIDIECLKEKIKNLISKGEPNIYRPIDIKKCIED